jgi:hypothetical protein
MKTMKTLVFITFAFLGINAYSQNSNTPTIKFDISEFNVGQIDENGGTITHRFNFTNTGHSPLVINNVNVTCGCTTSGWSKEPIAPGGKGYIDANFNPKGRPGKFTRSYTVLSNAENNQLVLKLTGEVISNLPTCENTAASIKFSDVNFEFKVKEGELVKHVYTFENTGNAALIIKEVKLNCDCVKAEIKNSTVAPGKKGEIVATFNTANELGDHNVLIDVLSNASNSSVTKLKFAGKVF